MKHFITFLYTLLICPLIWGQQAQITEINLSMGTYDFGDPNPVPQPDNIYYPYFRFDGYSDKKINKLWKAIELENDYIKVTLFPEIGGKVWGAMDKVNGKEFIYYNKVVKFRDIAMRGAWVSGGIEFNFGIIGHAPTTSTPVDYITREKPDGSVSCYISSFEFITRTMWTVEVNLQKDKAYFSTTTTWYNNSSVDQPYYQWMNAGYKSKGNAQFFYPGTHQISHSGKAFAFPFDDTGRDLSWYNNLNFDRDKSYHVLGKYNDFYGVFWHDDKHGSIHYSPYDEKLGMKIFTWSLSREGTIWEDLLTDNNGQYIELQSGRMYNQPANDSGRTPFRHAAFYPGQTDSWQELWYPISNTKGIVKASPLYALNVVKEQSSLKLYVSPLQDIDTYINVYVDGDLILNESVAFKTLSVWKKSIPITEKIKDGNLKVVIGDNKLVYSEDVEDNVINRPLNPPADFDWSSIYGMYISGEQWMNQKKFDKAEIDLKAALSEDRYFMPAIIRLASLYYQQGRYNESLNLCRRALSLNTYEGEANYIYGLCNMRLGNYTDAKDGFSLASYSMPIRTAAYTKLAGMFIRERDWQKAEEYANKSLQYNANNMEALNELLLCYRMKGQEKEFDKLSEELLEKYPLNHYFRYERYAKNRNTNNQAIFTSLIRNELPFESFLELAFWYESIGRDDEAIELLSMIQESPLACYQRAYILHRHGKEVEAIQLVEDADKLSPKLTFAFRPEALDALKWSADVSNSWKPTYYQAMLVHHLGDKNLALQLLNSRETNDYMPFYLYRASLEIGDKRLTNLKKAEHLGNSWRTGVELIKYYESINDWSMADVVAKSYYKIFPDNYVIGLQHAKTLSETGQYDACISLLDNIKVLPNEGAYAGRRLYRDVNLYKAIVGLKNKQFKVVKASIEKSKQWNENLGVGKPYEYLIDYRVENFIEALASDQTKAYELYRAVANTYIKDKKEFNSADLLTAIALCKIGKKSFADQWVQSWEIDYADNSMVKWCVSVYKEEKNNTDNLSGNNNDANLVTPWERASTDLDIKLIIQLFNVIEKEIFM